MKIGEWLILGALLVLLTSIVVQRLERRAAEQLAFQERAAWIYRRPYSSLGIYVLGSNTDTFNLIEGNRLSFDGLPSDGNGARFSSCNSDGFPIDELKSCRCDEHGHTTC
jgi:hypothetical protein